MRVQCGGVLQWQTDRKVHSIITLQDQLYGGGVPCCRHKEDGVQQFHMCLLHTRHNHIETATDYFYTLMYYDTHPHTYIYMYVCVHTIVVTISAMCVYWGGVPPCAIGRIEGGQTSAMLFNIFLCEGLKNVCM